ETKFALVGYSQGADVVGDTAALIANGRSTQVGPEKIVGVALFSDPSRSGNSTNQNLGGSEDLYASAPQGDIQRNKEILVTDKEVKGTGMAGQREMPFTGLEEKVISVCNPGDAARATPARDTPM